MINRFIIFSAFIAIGIATTVAHASTPDATVLIVMPFNGGAETVDMTGFIVNNSMDSNGNHYIMTARHGIRGEENQGYHDIEGIAIYGWRKEFMGYAHVAFCDPVWGNKQTNVEHDFCLLKIDNPSPEFSMNSGYNISSNLPVEGVSTCQNNAVISWTHGASGSPILIGDNVIGMLSMTWNEKMIPYSQWIQQFNNSDNPIPQIMIKTQHPENVVVQSCAMFPTFSTEVISFLGKNADSIRYVEHAVPSGIDYETYGFPNAYKVHISGKLG